MSGSQHARFGRIGLLMGGPSSEREISLKSAQAVYEGLSGLGLEVVPIDILSDDRQEVARLLQGAGLDCAFLALHGRFGEDGQIQGILDELKIPYTGSGARASSLAMDKLRSRQLFAERGLRVPACLVTHRHDPRPADAGDVPFPLPWVIKPVHQGSSIGLSIIDCADMLGAALACAFSFDQSVLVEEYVPGRELTVGILGDRALPVVEIVSRNRFFDYQAKYQSGLTEYIVPARLDERTAERVRQAALEAHRALGCAGYSRVDLILDETGQPRILELNSIPGMTRTSLLPRAAREEGIAFDQLCLRLLHSAYEKE